MDFSHVELSDDSSKFWREVSDFFDEYATEEVYEEERRTGSGHNHVLHKGLGERGWIMPTWPVDQGGGGLDPLHARILEIEARRRDVPDVTLSTTSLTVPVVRQYGTEFLKERVLPGVTTGDINICLGYTEPDGGSDLAGVRTRATRSDDGWIINGAKMFTTGAHNCQYSMMVTRSDPDAPKHRGITIFLVPLDGPGIEIQPVHTLGGERTNAVFYDNVFISDDHRLGPVNQGWSVMSAPLEIEHGALEHNGFAEINGSTYGFTLQKLLAHATRWAQTPEADGTTPFDDARVRSVLAEISVDVELARNVPGPMGRVISSELLIEKSAALLDLVGPSALIPRDADGAIEERALEWGHRFAQGTAIYGGTTDIARNIVAQHELHLPRPPKFV